MWSVSRQGGGGTDVRGALIVCDFDRLHQSRQRKEYAGRARARGIGGMQDQARMEIVAARCIDALVGLQPRRPYIRQSSAAKYKAIEKLVGDWLAPGATYCQCCMRAYLHA
jgi:hypothetical protein